jgi:hypothetical protein
VLLKATESTSRVRRAFEDPGLLACAAIGLALLGFSLSVNFPKVAYGFQSDEATYYSLGHSLARDLDFAFERQDLTRVWEEFPTGPEGIFLKRGKDVSLALSGTFPFVEWVKREDQDRDRLYYGKAYIYPLAAAPFVWLFGTNGFLVLHAVLTIANLAAAYLFLAARSSPVAALCYALMFFAASVAPVYYVWLTPDYFNLSLVLYGLFLWCYKEVAPAAVASPAGSRWLRAPASDIAAAVILGIATFSKPLNILLILPVVGLAAWRRQWMRGIAVGLTFGGVVTVLFLINVAITGEFNYQGGDRKTFYGGSGFPFQTDTATFETTGLDRATDRVPVEVLFNRDAFLSVLRHNLLYFTLGRHTGLVPYFFPGVLSLGLFLLLKRPRPRWQWLVAGTVILSALGLILYMPFTYSGGGGPVGNRYFLSFYPLFLFLTPPLSSPVSALVGLAMGGLFTAQLVLNPFFASFYPAQHPKSGPYRLLPVELTLVNDLPVNVTPSRAKQPLAGEPPITAYFMDDNAYNREGDWFWVRGESRAEIVVRAPARLLPDGRYESLVIERFRAEVRSGPVSNWVTVTTNGGRQDVQMGPGETQVMIVNAGGGLPYRPIPGQPTNYVYLVSVRSATGFIPLFTTGSRDNRFLGAMVRLVPEYRAGG